MAYRGVPMNGSIENVNTMCLNCKWGVHEQRGYKFLCELGGYVLEKGECEAFEECNKCSNCIHCKDVNLLGGEIAHCCEVLHGYVYGINLIKRTDCVNYERKY